MHTRCTQRGREKISLSLYIYIYSESERENIHTYMYIWIERERTQTTIEREGDSIPRDVCIYICRERGKERTHKHKK